MVRTDSPQDAAPQDVSHVRRWFVLVASLTAVWIVGLGVLSLLTANPVTLNRDQILDSVDVLTAVVEDPRAGRIRIEKSWKGFVEQEQLDLENLSELKVSANERLLIPVIRAARHWQVTQSKLPGYPPLIYPVTDESERQLRHLLKVGRLP